MKPTTSSRYSSFRDCERSLDPRRLRRALRHSWTNGVSPIDQRQLSAFGSYWRRGKVLLAFRLHTASRDKDRTNYARLSASLWLSRSGITRPPLLVCRMQICLRTIGLRPPLSNLVRDCCSASRRSLGRVSTDNR